jgi:hypothetical protein
VGRGDSYIANGRLTMGKPGSAFGRQLIKWMP